MGSCEKRKVVVSMRRTSLVLAVVAAMVTVLVFAAPAFAETLPIGPQPPPDTQATPTIPVPDNEDTCVGNLASGEAIDATRHEVGVLGEGPEPPGKHIL